MRRKGQSDGSRRALSNAGFDRKIGVGTAENESPRASQNCRGPRAKRGCAVKSELVKEQIADTVDHPILSTEIDADSQKLILAFEHHARFLGSFLFSKPPISDEYMRC